VADAELQVVRESYSATEEDRKKFAGCAIADFLAAAKAYQGKAEDAYYTAVAALRQGMSKEGRELLEKNAKAFPNHQPTHALLAQVYAQLNMPDEAIEQEAWAVALRHTTVGPILKGAWDRIQRTAFKSARTVLKLGTQIDAADGRIAAYRAVISLADGKMDEAIADLRIATALEEARLRLRGHTFDSSDSIPVTAEEIGMFLTMRNKLVAALTEAGKGTEAVEVASATTAIEPKVQSEVTKRVESAMLPEPSLDPNMIPMAPTVASLFAGWHVGLGNAALSAKRYNDAEREFNIARSYEGNWPATAEGRESVWEADTRAYIGLCKLMLAQRRAGEAARLRPPNPPWGNRALENETRAIMDQVQRANGDQ